MPTSTPDLFLATKNAGSNSSKYGVITHSEVPTVLDWTLLKTKAESFVHFSSKVDYIPAGKSRLLYVEVTPTRPVLTTAEIQVIANALPGGTWYVSGEPNVRYSADELIEDLRYYYTEIKSVDPTARITSPSILNWDFTCLGCGGYTSGLSWMTSFVSRYQDLYGTLPPWDIWAIDLYPLDWQTFPTTGFLPETIAQYAPNRPPDHELIPVKQLQAYRDYIDSLPGKSGQPIIVTEIGLHWGWTGIEFGIPGCDSGSPTGSYQSLAVRDYFNSAYTWFEDHSISHNIERWFTYVTYSDIASCRYDGYSGMSLLDSGEVGGELSDVGRWYVSRSAP